MTTTADILAVAGVKDEDVEHYGRKGMKWGVRRQRGADGLVKSDDAKDLADIRTKTVPALTNKELQRANQRMNLEKQYRSLNPGSMKRGEKILKGLVATGSLAASLVALQSNPAAKSAMSAGAKILSGRRGPAPTAAEMTARLAEIRKIGS